MITYISHGVPKIPEEALPNGEAVPSEEDDDDDDEEEGGKFGGLQPVGQIAV